jgi:hypothetical protein
MAFGMGVRALALDTTPWGRALSRDPQLCSYWRPAQHLVAPGGSLQCSQEPSTGPYPETDQSSPPHPTPPSPRRILMLFNIYMTNKQTFSRNFLFLQYSSLTFFHDMFRPPGPSSGESQAFCSYVVKKCE